MNGTPSIIHSLAKSANPGLWEHQNVPALFLNISSMRDIGELSSRKCYFVGTFLPHCMPPDHLGRARSTEAPTHSEGLIIPQGQLAASASQIIEALNYIISFSSLLELLSQRHRVRKAIKIFISDMY